jgi:hypothetical protein
VTVSTREIEITVDRFLGAFKDTNPFAKNKVTEIGDAEVDVPGIHSESFAKLTRGIDNARRNRVSTGIMLLGGAGLGKSHLLARLSHWALSDRHAVVIFLHNVIASPEQMARYVLRAALSGLAGHRQDAYCESGLYQLINQGIEGQLRSEGKRGVPTMQVRLKALGQIARGGIEDTSAVKALAAFLQESIAATGGEPGAEMRAAAAVEWLAGEVIENELASHLGLPQGDDQKMVVTDQRIESVFRVLARLAEKAGRALILCIDQVDNLDEDQVSALASHLHVLIDHVPNLVVVTSGVKQSLTRLRENGTIPEAAWDRIAQHTVELQRVDAEQAREIVETRVQRFMQPFRAVGALTAIREKQPLFPLDAEWLGSRLDEGVEFRPRDIISWAHARWEEQQDRVEALGAERWLGTWAGDNPGSANAAGKSGAKTAPRSARGSGNGVSSNTGPGRGASNTAATNAAGRGAPKRPAPSLDDVIDAAAQRKLAERLQERRLRPETLPPDADNLSTLVLGLLAHCRNHPQYSLLSAERCPQKQKSRIYDLKLRERRPDAAEVTTGVVFVTSANKTSVASVLKHLADDPSPPDHRVLVTDEERRPLPLGPKGKEHFDKLAKLGASRFEHVRLTFDEYAHLDAIAGLLGSSRVGDFEVDHPLGETRSVSEGEAVESLHRQSKFVSHRLLREFLTEDAAPLPPAVPEKPAIDALRVRATIQENLAWRLGLTTRELTRLVIDKEPMFKNRFDDVHEQIRTIASKMHDERLLFATAQDEQMFLQLSGAR